MPSERRFLHPTLSSLESLKIDTGAFYEAPECVSAFRRAMQERALGEPFVLPMHTSATVDPCRMGKATLYRTVPQGDSGESKAGGLRPVSKQTPQE